jgi:hypothetical protein
MQFVYYDNLTPKAKKAFNRGDGDRSGFRINAGCIAKLDIDGRPLDFIKVIKTKAKDIKEVTIKDKYSL